MPWSTRPSRRRRAGGPGAARGTRSVRQAGRDSMTDPVDKKICRLDLPARPSSVPGPRPCFTDPAGRSSFTGRPCGRSSSAARQQAMAWRADRRGHRHGRRLRTGDDAGPAVADVNFRVDYLRPAFDTALVATARVRRNGKQVGVVDVDVATKRTIAGHRPGHLCDRTLTGKESDDYQGSLPRTVCQCPKLCAAASPPSVPSALRDAAARRSSKTVG